MKIDSFKEPLRGLLDRTWKKRSAEVQSDDLAGIIDFNRGSLEIQPRQRLIDGMTKEIRTVFDSVPALRRIHSPAGDEEPKAPRERSLWLIIIEMPRGIALERIVRET